MTQPHKVSLLLIALFAAGLSGACTPVRQTQGIFLSADQVAQVQPGATRADVLQTLGTPTTTAVFDDTVWYYIGQQTEKTAFLDPKVTDRKIYEVRFGGDGTVLAVQQLEGEEIDVPLASRTTPTSGHDLTFAQQLLGNIGRFNKEKTMPGAE